MRYSHTEEITKPLLMKIDALTWGTNPPSLNERLAIIPNRVSERSAKWLLVLSTIPTAIARCRSLYTQYNTVCRAEDAIKLGIPTVGFGYCSKSEIKTHSPQTQFTPGPWKWVGTQGNPELFAFLGNPNHEHDYVFVNLSGFKPTPENARLIASAPALYAALQRLLEADDAIQHRNDLLPGDRAHNRFRAMEQARKALAMVSSGLGSSTPR